MLKKNTRKRLLAGALATVMMLTMCPSWALADDEDIAAPLPLVDENRPVAESAPVETDTTETPAVPTPSEPEAKPDKGQDPAPAPSDGGANGGTDSTESGNSTNPTVPEGSENNSQNNDVVSNSPENEISTQALQISFPGYYRDAAAKYFVLLPKRNKPKNNADQGQINYLPSSYDKDTHTEGSDGGVQGLDASTGYPGSVTVAGMEALAGTKDRSITNIEEGVPAKYLDMPKDLGFFNEDYWGKDGKYTGHGDPATILGENFNGKDIEIVWYTIKDQREWDVWHWVGDIHVDGYVKNVAINVTYHSNFGEDETFNHGTKTGTNYEALSYADTGLSARENYKFVGWYTDQECTEPYTTTTLMTSLDLYAKWDSDKYTVTWENEGTTLGTEPVAYGKMPIKTFTPEKPSTPESDYKFLGWKVKDGNSELVNPNTTPVIKDVTYVAVFEETKRQYTVTYYINGTEYGTTKKYAVDTTVTVEPIPTETGRTFSGWTSNDVKLDGASFTMPAKDVTIQGFLTQNKRDYTINKHFYDEKGVEVKTENGKTKTGNEYALISELYKKDAVNQTVDGKNYVYVPGLTTVTDNLETLTKDVTIDLHYYLNVEGGNDIPDAWEYRLTFKVVNGEWNDGGNADIVTYVQFKDQTTGEAFKDEAVVVPATRIPEVGEKPNSGYHAGSWNTTFDGKTPVKQDTVFTYTYAKNSSGGSSGGSGGHHRKPTVTIPDKVPTGLNGNDHYAYIVGYPDKTVRPQNGITRAEVATIFFRLLTDETRNANSTKSNSYSDVAAGAWYNHAVSTLSAMGIVKGDSNGKFNPNAPITRAEFAAIAARFDDKANSTTADFSDIVSHWAKNEISAASNNGWINGYPDGTFRPDNKITRAEAMTLVNRVLKRLPETAEDLHDDMIKWSDNSDASQWFYLAVQEATNSHYYKAKENKSEKWTELRDTRDWTELEK